MGILKTPQSAYEGGSISFLIDSIDGSVAFQVKRGIQEVMNLLTEPYVWNYRDKAPCLKYD